MLRVGVVGKTLGPDDWETTCGGPPVPMLGLLGGGDVRADELLVVHPTPDVRNDGGGCMIFVAMIPQTTDPFNLLNNVFSIASLAFGRRFSIFAVDDHDFTGKIKKRLTAILSGQTVLRELAKT